MMVNKPPAPLCESLSWDSEFFECRIARILANRLSPESLETVEAWCRLEAIDCVYWVAEADHEQTIRLAKDHDFNLVDIRLTLSKDLTEHKFESSRNSGGSIRPALPQDLSALRAIARHSHHDTRFYFDPHFAKAKCDALYEIWIEKSCQGYADAVLVAQGETQVVGYITCKSLDPESGQIGLLAVDQSSVGVGLGSRLIKAALGWFYEHGHKQVFVVTQGRNIRAQRSYQRAGFVTESLQLSYHRWFCRSHREAFK
jgi:dTDP-4-amino-4,6-dideoxy-D-galactose acyltransferase